MNKYLSVLLILIMLVNITGCATTGLTPFQRRVLECEELDGTYEDAFKATIYILQDNGYVIKTSDFEAGLVYAELATETGARPSPGWLLLAPLYGAGIVIYGALSCGKRPYCYRATISFEQFTEDRVKMRISLSGIFDNRKTELIDNPKIYQAFFADIQKEMFRRAQLNT